jgi:hypothetical protein
MNSEDTLEKTYYVSNYLLLLEKNYESRSKFITMDNGIHCETIINLDEVTDLECNNENLTLLLESNKYLNELFNILISDWHGSLEEINNKIMNNNNNLITYGTILIIKKDFCAVINYEITIKIFEIREFEVFPKGKGYGRTFLKYLKKKLEPFITLTNVNTPLTENARSFWNQMGKEKILQLGILKKNIRENIEIWYKIKNNLIKLSKLEKSKQS